MLVLSRKANQSIRIGDDIEIVVTRICGSTARLAIRAPQDVPITRSELLCCSGEEMPDDTPHTRMGPREGRSEAPSCPQHYSTRKPVLAVH